MLTKTKEKYMKEQMSGKWDQLKGEFKKSWGKLTDDELMLYNGQQDKFYGKLKEKYGIAKEEAEKNIKEYKKNIGL